MADKLKATHGISTIAFRRLSLPNRLRLLRGQPLIHDNPKPKPVMPRRPQPQPLLDKQGVGTHFRRMTEQIINEKLGCGCHVLASEMNQLGPEKCRERLDELVARIEQNAKSYTWWERATASVLAATHAFEWHLDPLNPIRSMLLEAIRRAEVGLTES